MTNDDRKYIARAVELALETERHGNLPIGAVIVLNGEIVAEAGNCLIAPFYHPGRHAETEALRGVPAELWTRSREMTCYTTLEPCVMCFGALLLHGIGRVIFGAEDKKGGAGVLLNHLPEYYEGGSKVPLWIGPAASQECDALYERAARRFAQLSVG